MAFKQGLAWWSFARTDVEPLELIRAAKAIGCSGFDMVPEDCFQLVRDNGLQIAAQQLHVPLQQGVSHKKYWDDIKRQADANFKLAGKWDIPYLIAFSGNREGLDDARGAENAIAHLEALAADAASAGVILLLELLNSKLNHPDYQCDSTAWGVEVVSAVDSPHVRLLYDIYHMQVMEGDVIQTIRDNHQWIAHYHTAGVPGRQEIDDTQELNYPAICRTIAATGFSGYVTHEFMPAGNWKTALQQAYDICNVD